VLDSSLGAGLVTKQVVAQRKTEKPGSSPGFFAHVVRIGAELARKRVVAPVKSGHRNKIFSVVVAPVRVSVLSVKG